MEQIGRETVTVMRPCFVSNIISDYEAESGCRWRLWGQGGRRVEQDESAVLVAMTGL